MKEEKRIWSKDKRF